MDADRRALLDRVATSLRACDTDGSGALVRGLLANGALPAAGVNEDGPVDYEVFVRWLLGDKTCRASRVGSPSPPLPQLSRGEAKLEPLEWDEVLRLNVGGYRFTTSLATVQACPPGCLLGDLLRRPADEDGSYWIDRDGRQFHHLLNFLRDGSSMFVPPMDPMASRELYHEACYYKLWDLALAVQNAYQGAPLPSNEEARLQKLESLNIMHTDDREMTYDCLTRIVQSLLDMPIVLISLVGDDHQWFKSRCGLAATQTPKNTSFCAFSFLPETPEVLVVENAVTDPRTCNNPLVIGEPYIGFYAGCPLVTSDGFRLGALCVIDQRPRKLAKWQYQALVNFGHIAVQEIQRAELEKMSCPVENVALEDFEEMPSSTNSASARREAWRGFGTQRQTRDSYASGLQRTTRMKEALGEIVCLVQVNAENMSWPILYANHTWTDFTDLQIHPPGFTIGLDKPGSNSSKFLNWPSLWDFLALTNGTEEEPFLKYLREAWEIQREPHVFGLSACLISAPRQGWHGLSKEVPVPVSCRFVPVHQSLDVAAAAVNSLPKRPVKTAKTNLHPNGEAPACYLYYVLMVMVDNSVQEDAAESAVEDGRVRTQESVPEVPSESTLPTADSATVREAIEGCSAGSRAGLDENTRQDKGASSSGKSTPGQGRHTGQVQLKPTRPPFQDVRLNKKVGEGSFGKVFYGHWLGSPVAVKVVEWTGKRDVIEPFFEAELSCTLSHPNLVQTFKYSTREKQGELEPGSKKKTKKEVKDGDPIEATYHTWIVQEWCEMGTLRTLCDHPRDDSKGHSEVLHICSEIASAGSYLHSRGIIHGDLTANNVLCKTQVSRKGYVCKICDFGLARILEGENTGILTNQLGTVTHMPPELFQMDSELELTTKADVYASGVLMWQAVCGQSPWAGLAAPMVVVQIAKGKRLRMPVNAPAYIVEIFDKCTADDPEERPTMDELSETLQNSLRKLEVDSAGSAGSVCSDDY